MLHAVIDLYILYFIKANRSIIIIYLKKNAVKYSLYKVYLSLDFSSQDSVYITQLKPPITICIMFCGLCPLIEIKHSLMDDINLTFSCYLNQISLKKTKTILILTKVT